MTIIEVIVVLAIIAVLTGISLFYLNSDNFRLKSEAQNLRSFLMEAKAEAVKRNSRATVNLSPTGYDLSIGDSVLASHLLDNRVSLVAQNLGILTTSSVSFSSMGTADNSHFKIASSSRNYSIRINSAGRVIIEGPFSGGPVINE